MTYFHLNITPTSDPDAVFMNKAPEGTMNFKTSFTKGKKAKDKWPKGAWGEVDTDSGGTKLTSLVGNTLGMVIVSKAVQEVISKGNVGEVEYLPLSLYLPKKKLLSHDYFVVNSLEVADCLDLKASAIEWMGDKVVSVDEPVLSTEKVKKLPHLFRIREAPRMSVLHEDLVFELQKINPDNFFFFELKQA